MIQINPSINGISVVMDDVIGPIKNDNNATFWLIAASKNGQRICGPRRSDHYMLFMEDEAVAEKCGFEPPESWHCYAFANAIKMLLSNQKESTL